MNISYYRSSGRPSSCLDPLHCRLCRWLPSCATCGPEIEQLRVVLALYSLRFCVGSTLSQGDRETVYQRVNTFQLSEILCIHYYCHHHYHHHHHHYSLWWALDSFL